MSANKRSTVYFLVGVPGSGKSTWAEHKAKTDGLSILSSDNLRQELTGDAADQGTVPPAELFRRLEKLVEAKLQAGEDVIYDATNVERRFRQKLLTQWKQNFQANITGVVFLTPKEVAQARNLARDKQVLPPKAIERMWNQFVSEPIDTAKEWFDTIVAVDENMQEQEIYRFEKAKHPSDRLEIKVSPEEFTPKIPRSAKH